jgi:hypothetical protein
MKTKTHRLPQKFLAGSILAAVCSSSVAGAKITIDDDSWISLGVGLRSSISMTKEGAPDGSSRSTDFNMESTRLYISGQATKEMKFYFGTDRMWGEYGVLDAIVQYEPSPSFNVWMGHLLTPADRIEMNGPFYALTWGQYTVPLFPSDNDINNGANGQAGTYGRDNGVTFWGSIDKFQYAFGIFEGYTGDANQTDAPLYATRLAYNFLSKESNPGYYTSSTYFGKGGDIFTLALSAQSQSEGYGTVAESGSFKGYAVDALFEKPLAGGSAVTVEAEYKKFEVSTDAATPDFGMFDGKSYFASAAYLIGNSMGSGKFQPYLRFTKNEPSVGDSSDLKELGVNYVISGQNAKLNLNFTSGDANASGAAGTDTKTATFGMQFQL